MSGVFTIAPGTPFGETLARGLVERLGDDALALADVTIYLPTRRAARNFGEAFGRVLGGAALLPQFRALGDSDEEDFLFDGAGDGLELPPAISPIRRQLLLASLIRRWEKAHGQDIGFAHAAALAESLAQVIDEVQRQEADLTKLDELVPLPLAAHWEQVTRFLTLIRDQWPKLLEAENAIDPAARRNLALVHLAERLQSHPPSGLVIAAGSTGSIPATARLLGVIAKLSNGAVILPGLDRDLDQESWQRLDPGHPQYGLKQLLDAIGHDRRAVKDWHGRAAPPPRQKLIAEALRPAPTTDAWRALADEGRDLSPGLEELSLAAAADPAEEALVIALALRETLEHDGRTAALITPDRTLARRVAAELGRWNIAIDDSAGRPLAHTSAGAFLCLLAEAADASFAPLPLLALLKHPFATLGEEPATFRAHVRTLDRLALRGPRPDPGLDGISRRIAMMAHARTKEERAASRLLGQWWRRIEAVLGPLEQAFAKPELGLDELIAVHLKTAEQLSCGDPADCPIWREADGEAAALFFHQFHADAAGIPALEPGAYPQLLRTLAMRVPVRPRYNRHPQIAILGPLEARLQSFDLIILGGLNEGTWPQTAMADPWFSRPMRQMLGLEQPERLIGLAAHDFATLAAGKHVLLTRAAKVEGAPTIPSRWLQRLMQLTSGLGLRIDESRFVQTARRLGEIPFRTPEPPPSPTPPIVARPRKLSVTEIETWLRDPYAIYARHVLALEPLDPLDAAIGPLERGQALHRALEIYKQRFPDMPPEDALGRLMAIADDVFGELAIPKALLSVWRPRFENAARWFLSLERERAQDIAHSVLEIRGERTFPAPGGDFKLTGIADRIDILKNGNAAILDYKSGKPPTIPQVKELITPQLPLEGAILAEGGFPGLGALKTEELLYLHISGRGEGGTLQPLPNVPELIERAAAQLALRISRFDDSKTPYPPRVKPFSMESVGDYDHLARVRAWSVSGWEEE